MVLLAATVLGSFFVLSWKKIRCRHRRNQLHVRAAEINHPRKVVVLWRSVPINPQHQTRLQSQVTQDLFATIRFNHRNDNWRRGIRARCLPRLVEGRTKGCATNRCRTGGNKVIGRRSHRRRSCNAMAVYRLLKSREACQSLQASKQASVARARARQTSQISEKIGRDGDQGSE